MSKLSSSLFQSNIKPSGTTYGYVFNWPKEPTRPVTSAVYERMQKSKAENGSYLKSKFSPMQLGNKLPHIYLLKVLKDPDDYLVAVFGSKCAEVIGDDYTGKKISELVDSHWRVPFFNEARDDNKFLVSNHYVGTPTGNHHLIETIFVPMCDGDGNVSHILLCFDLIPGNLRDFVDAEKFDELTEQAKLFFASNSDLIEE